MESYPPLAEEFPLSGPLSGTAVFLRRYLSSFETARLPQLRADVLVLGSGIAGLRAAIAAAEHGRVLVATKAAAIESNTAYAQGGVAAAFAPEDTPEGHIDDTIKGGAGLCGQAIVELVVHEGIDRVRELIDWGARFDRTPGGQLAWTREGGHTHPRILHAEGDATGREVARTLLERVRAHPNILLMENVFAIDLITAGGECVGVLASCQPPGAKGRAAAAPHALLARATVLATGGCGRVFRETTNPQVATGDGMAMACRAGATIVDAELVQFHPTVLYVAGASRALVSEAVRGEGAYLVDGDGVRFMVDRHEMAELAPRDVVSRAIVDRIRETGHPCCYLDLGHLEADRIKARFPGIDRLCQGFGLDLATDRIPVRPAAHYMIGGVETDDRGMTTIPRLYAAGEVSCTTLHGANRLGSNSLLEGLVFGQRAGEEAGRLAAGDAGNRLGGEDVVAGRSEERELSYPPIDIEDATASLRSLLWQRAGVERSGDGLGFALKQIDFWSRYILGIEADSPRAWELQNMILLGTLIVRQALWREESRGVHHRLDHPGTRDDLGHSRVCLADLTGETATAVAVPTAPDGALP